MKRVYETPFGTYSVSDHILKNSKHPPSHPQNTSATFDGIAKSIFGRTDYQNGKLEINSSTSSSLPETQKIFGGAVGRHTTAYVRGNHIEFGSQYPLGTESLNRQMRKRPERFLGVWSEL